MKHPIKLVIFDCDGVLVDSEVLDNQVLVHYLAQLGISMTLDQAVAKFRGCKMADLVLEIERQYNRKLPESFIVDFRTSLAMAFQTELKAIDGIADAIDAIQIPMCVASNGPVEKIRLTLGVTGLLKHFEGHIFSAYEVGSWKPDPGLFLHAAKIMGADPAHCMVVEDSILGVQAAVAAGMRVLGYAPDLPQQKILAAAGATVLPTMAALPSLLLNPI